MEVEEPTPSPAEEMMVEEDPEDEEDMLPEGAYDPLDGFGVLVHRLDGCQREGKLKVKISICEEVDGVVQRCEDVPEWNTPFVEMGVELGRYDWEERTEWTEVEFGPEGCTESPVRLLIEVIEKDVSSTLGAELEDPIGWCKINPFDWTVDEFESFPSIMVEQHKVHLFKHQDGEACGTERLGAAAVTVSVFDPFEPPQFVELSGGEQPELDSECWVLGNTTELQKGKTFDKESGVDIYVDMGRFFADNVSASKVTLFILASNGRVLHGPVERTCVFSRSCFHPVYALRIEIRETQLDPTATLLLQVDTIDEQEQTVYVVGYALLQMFAEPSSRNQPKPNSNEGARLFVGNFQLPLYSRGIEAGVEVSCGRAVEL